MKIGICGSIFDQVYKVIVERKQSSPEKSYVASLMKKGTDSILKKLVKNQRKLSSQQKTRTGKKKYMKFSDLWFHMLILMVDKGIMLEEISKEFKKRFGQSGLEEKARRN